MRQNVPLLSLLLSPRREGPLYGIEEYLIISYTNTRTCIMCISYLVHATHFFLQRAKPLIFFTASISSSSLLSRSPSRQETYARLRLSPCLSSPLVAKKKKKYKKTPHYSLFATDSPWRRASQKHVKNISLSACYACTLPYEINSCGLTRCCCARRHLSPPPPHRRTRICIIQSRVCCRSRPIRPLPGNPPKYAHHIYIILLPY